MTTNDSSKETKPVHHGRNIKRFREMFGLKQDGLAARLGPDWTQKKVSQLEATEVVESKLLTQIAEALKVPAESIENFTEEAATQFFQNFHDNSAYNYYCTFNPLDKYVEMVDKNERLYETLLKAEREKIALLERLLEKTSSKR
jgi:transcriptional regulator with XRE-family HTH domain